MLSLIAHEPSKRLTAAQALRHPYFWPPRRRLAFLDDVANKLDRLRPQIENIARCAAHTADKKKSTRNTGMYWQWGDSIDPRLLSSLERYRKYDRASLPDLLRLVRNLDQHFGDQTHEALAVLHGATSIQRPPTISIPANNALEASISVLERSVTSTIAEGRLTSAETATEVSSRDEVVGKLREAAAAGNAAQLRSAVAEAEASGLAHEAGLGRRRLARLSEECDSPTRPNMSGGKNESVGSSEAQWRAAVLGSTAKQRDAIEAYITGLYPSLVVDLWHDLGSDF